MLYLLCLYTSNTLYTTVFQGGDIFLGSDYQVGKLDLDSMCAELNKIDSCIYNTRCTWCKEVNTCLKAT